MQLLLLDSDNDPVHIEACSFYVGTKNINWGFESPGMCHYVAVKEPPAFWKNVSCTRTSSGLQGPRRWRQLIPSKHQDALIQQCSVTSQKTNILNTNFIKTHCIWTFSPKKFNINSFEDLLHMGQKKKLKTGPSTFTQNLQCQPLKIRIVFVGWFGSTRLVGRL